MLFLSRTRPQSHQQPAECFSLLLLYKFDNKLEDFSRHKRNFPVVRSASWHCSFSCCSGLPPFAVVTKRNNDDRSLSLRSRTHSRRRIFANNGIDTPGPHCTAHRTRRKAISNGFFTSCARFFPFPNANENCFSRCASCVWSRFF